MSARADKPAAGRIKSLRMLQGKPHRLERLRIVTQAITLAALYAVPLTGLARFDAWGGDHRAGLSRVTSPIMALGWTLVAIAGFYVVTFAVNAFLGRVFCGFGCPVGHAARLADETEAARKTAVYGAWAKQLTYAVAFSGAVVSWWVSPRVLSEGSVAAVAATIGVWGLVACAVILHGRYFRWRFCRSYCPIGVYYSAVQTVRRFGIHYDASRCEDCGVCQKACPVALDPRDLSAPIENRGGISIDGFPASHHCLTCGDCVRACEHVLRRRQDGKAALSLWLR